MTIQLQLIAGLVAAALALPAMAQALTPDFVHGVDYRFERMTATRRVNDAQDRGRIKLVTLVYRPLKADRHEVVLFSHGSTGGEIRSPQEPWEGPPLSVIRFFTSRGYTLVAPMRRGRGESSGTYVEECAIYAGACTLAQQTAMLDRTVREAMLDTDAVIHQVILGRLAPRNAKFMVAGVSRGGFLSLLVASRRPAQVKAVVNFVGGWLSVSDKYPADQNQLRLSSQLERFAEAGRHARAPSLWVYASKDELYAENVTREFFRAFREAGGNGDYQFIAQHSLPNGHLIAGALPLWEAAVDAFLKKIDG